MSEWIDFSVYATLCVALWFIFPAWAMRFTPLYLADRNPEWVRTHREQVRRLSASRGFRAACGAWGFLCLGVLLVFQLDMNTGFSARLMDSTARWEALKDLNSLLLIPGGLGLFAVAAVRAAHVRKVVPPANVRRAGLEPRTLAGVVPRPVQIATYGVIGLVLLGWAMVAALNAFSTPKFWGRAALLVVISLAFAFFLRVSVKRPPHVMDRIFGPVFRADEVRFTFGLQLLPPLTGAVRLYEEVANVVLVDVNRAMHLGVALVIVVWVLRLTRYSSPGSSSYGDEHSGGTLRWSTP
jgi:hypothetical protein